MLKIGLLLATLIGTVHIPDFDRLQWHNRLVLIFASAASEPMLREQQQELAKVTTGLAERDMKVFTILGDGAEARQARERFRVPGVEFAVLLVGKDGSCKLRRSTPVQPSELFALVDSMPMRRTEKLQRTE